VTDEIKNGTVVWFNQGGIEMLGIVNGEREDFVDTDGIARTLYPVHQPQANANWFVWAENIARIENG
jgi:hypothetical protein